ncbi:SNF2 domain-containing protein CLASSY 1-like [Gastrolobium bilobum]|uniref:SNF2 domain-containing protein CLASSY 1-like n=1 Tax=Gastrolobium bilobum TaxID=150636 RepID=UPI002AB00E28|nr:SNF2 domain-containing protein CLASSY 1-like [Gastrolobium bilobum]
MTQRKRHLHQWKHPFDSYAFEAFVFGSWQAVEFIKIESGTLTIHFMDNHHMTIEKGFADIRIRSRKASSSDCSCFLRPGIDICVLSPSQCSDDSDDFIDNPVWADAKINSIQRKSHESGCSCQYYVNLYDNQGFLGTQKGTLSKEVKVVERNQISILQKLERDSCEDQYYRWASSEDCSTVSSQPKLISGNFLSDLSWLVVASVLTKVSFCARSVKNKIVYQVLGNDDTICSSSNTNSHINVVNFKVKDGILEPFVTKVDTSDTKSIGCNAHDSHEDEVTPQSYEAEGLRRSKRRNTQPDRYLGCDVSELDVDYVQTRPYKKRKGKDDEEPLPLAIATGLFENCPKEVDKVSSSKELRVYHRKKKRKEVNSGDANQNENQTRDHKVQRKDVSEFDDMDIEPRWEGLNSKKGVEDKKYHSMNTTSRNHYVERAYKDRTLNADVYKEIIDSHLKNMNKIPIVEEPSIKEKWTETSCFGKEKEAETSEGEAEEELSEMDMLWREMDMALASSYLEETEGSNAANLAEKVEKPNETCQHDNRLDEQIGIYCLKCGYVTTEIRNISAPFVSQVERRGWYRGEKQCIEEESEPKADNDDDFNLFSTHASRDEPISEENQNVWSLIPELKEKMHVHQKKAFEFLWQNIAGSMKPALVESESKRRGGCVISHAPGAGKTLTIIAFLASYLKLFPWKRPLILAPKTILYTWHKEFIKWKVSLPVYMIHSRRSQRDFNDQSMVLPGIPKPTNDVKHVLDSLDKIQKWHAHPSVLVMGYTSFLSLTRENSKFAHRKYMAKVLRESPGILILDEGHNPRSTKSRLRKALMKVETKLRIVLSGTLFQNNFCEYFNTLCMARPKFVHEVLKELDPKYRRGSKTAEKAPHLLESRARKFFLDNIAKRIDSYTGEVRMQGLSMLRKLTNSFIDVYDSGNSDNLPGLQLYTLLMNTTDIQHEILQTLHEKTAVLKGYPLEIELLITLGSIHPWLVKTATWADKFFTPQQMKQLDKCKLDFKMGSKLRFVLNLVFRVIQKEKVLIFCHNHAPVKLLVELFEKIFKWKKGREILVLNGEQELFERGKVIEKFEENGGISKILLASITACGEGISLTAASRVIMLDSEWNPSKTKQAIARAFRPGQQKMVYVYQLLTKGTLEEDKYRRTTWKEWVSSMIFSEAFVEDPSKWQAQKIEDDILREMVEEDNSKSIHMIMKNEKASTN